MPFFVFFREIWLPLKSSGPTLMNYLIWTGGGVLCSLTDLRPYPSPHWANPRYVPASENEYFHTVLQWRSIYLLTCNKV